MRGECRFFRTSGGVVAYAHVAVSSEPAPEAKTAWRANLETMKRVWGNDVERGIRLAAAEHQKRGGTPHLVHVDEVIDVPVDTKSDAMACAALIAAWKSWGRSEAELKLELQDGEWVVRFDG
jgi:hypothetical protein